MQKVLRNTWNMIMLISCTIFAGYMLANMAILLPNTAFYHTVIGMLVWLIVPMVVVVLWTGILAAMLFADNNN